MIYEVRGNENLSKQFVIDLMEGYIEEEQQETIRGWEDNDQNPMYVQICVRGPPLPPEEPPLSKAETAHRKLPFKQHRRSSSKPVITPKHPDQNILRIDKQILNKYLTRQSQKNLLESPSENVKSVFPEPKASSQSKHNKKSISGVNIELYEGDLTKSIKDELFSGGKSSKKNRRKFHVKSKLLQQVIPTCLDHTNHRKRTTSKIASKYFDFQQPSQSHEIESKKENNPKRSQSRIKRTFPVFWRELEIQQKEQQKKMYKRILDQKIRSRKNRTHFMLASKNPFENSIEFTDNNIFPPRFIRT